MTFAPADLFASQLSIALGNDFTSPGVSFTNAF